MLIMQVWNCWVRVSRRYQKWFCCCLDNKLNHKCLIRGINCFWKKFGETRMWDMAPLKR